MSLSGKMFVISFVLGGIVGVIIGANAHLFTPASAILDGKRSTELREASCLGAYAKAARTNQPLELTYLERDYCRGLALDRDLVSKTKERLRLADRKRRMEKYGLEEAPKLSGTTSTGIEWRVID